MDMDKEYAKLNDSSHTFVIAEAGSNWKCGSYEEDLERAKELIKIASISGADAIKFQTYKPETTYVQDAGTSTYLSQYGIKENINEIFKNLSMPQKMIPELAKYCKIQNIMFMSTPFSVQDAKEVDPYVTIHKISSFEINHVRLLEFISNTNKPILISTGASTFDEIDFAVNLIKKRNKKIALLQCTSKYPSPIEALNISAIPQIKSKYGIPVGLSDHSEDPIIGPILSIGYGATIIEKHFTIDKNLPGPDHPFALEPDELKLMIKMIRQAELAKGTGEKEILKVELELRKFATRSIQAIKDISKGDILQEGINFDILRSGNQSRGIEPRFLDEISGKKATKNIKSGEGITQYE